MRQILDYLLEYDKKNIFPYGSFLASLDHPETTKHLRFTRWAKQNGAVLNKTKLVLYYKDSRGLHATTEIKESKTIIKVPLSICISYDSILSTELGATLTALEVITPNLRPYVYPLLYGLHLMAASDSFYKPWIDVLPKTMDHPLFYSEEELKRLRNSTTLLKIEHDKRQLKMLYDEVEEKFHSFTFNHSFDDFLKIYYILGSRFFTHRSGGRNSPLLAPYADMANCGDSEEANAVWDTSEDGRFFVLRARVDIPKNSPVTFACME